MVSSSRKTPRRGATTQRNKTTKTSRLPMPGWLWALGGLVVGFFLAHYQNGKAPWQDDPASGPEATVISREQRDDSAAEGSADDDEASMPTFEFYTLLPETEVIAPGGVVSSTVEQPEPEPETAPAEEVTSNTSGQLTEDEQSAEPEEPIAESTPVSNDDPIAELIAANNTENTERSAAAAQPATPTAEEEQKRYMLQAASFLSETDAGRMRDRLKNLSLLAHISKVQANGDTWHRVQVGPYDDPRELNRAQDLMNTQGIEPLLIQLQN